jgi:hypothetical protein
MDTVEFPIGYDGWVYHPRLSGRDDDQDPQCIRNGPPESIAGSGRSRVSIAQTLPCPVRVSHMQKRHSFFLGYIQNGAAVARARDAWAAALQCLGHRGVPDRRGLLRNTARPAAGDIP